jgi:spore coat protein CotH
MVLSYLCVGCGSSGNSAETDKSDTDMPIDELINLGAGTSDDLFDPDRIIDVNIEMSATEFASLRAEGRTLASASSECLEDYEYTEFVASVTIDGVEIPNVEIRKKGFLGSISRIRPSLKLDFDTFVDDRTYNEMSRMTLNNDRQDPSHTHQCMAYEMFRKAGLAAPRCNLARVTVNDEVFGIYTNVENIKKPFLKRNFSNNDGNLYEAQITDFGTHTNDKFEKKTNKSEDDRSDLAQVSNALALDDENLIAALSQLIDIDEFIRFWAVETLIGQWDSATGNANNYYIYNNPDDGLFHYIPWGADAAFTGVNPIKPNTGPLYRNINIASRLYAIEQYKTQYHNTLTALMNTLWDEENLLAEVDRVKQLTSTPESSFTNMRLFISGSGSVGQEGYIRSQRDLLTRAIAGLEPEQTEYLVKDEVLDCDTPAPMTNLTATVQSIGGLDTGTFTFINQAGKTVTADLYYASLKVDALQYSVSDLTLPSIVSLLLIGADAGDAFKPYVLQVFIESPDYVEGEHALQGIATNLLLFEVDESVVGGVRTIALGSTGAISLNSIGGVDSEGDLNMSINAELEFQ